MLTVNSLSTRLFIYDVIMHVEICKQVRDRAFGDKAIAANAHRQNNNLNATVIQSYGKCAYGHMLENIRVGW